MCAGVTTYNVLRNSGARVGDVVAILGIGGRSVGEPRPLYHLVGQGRRQKAQMVSYILSCRDKVEIMDEHNPYPEDR